MGILKGAMSVRRYRVEGALPEGWRDTFVEALDAAAFRDPLSPTRKEERGGWGQIHNLLDTGFADIGKWLYQPYVILQVRVDKKTLPAKLFRAHLDKRVRAWCEENQRERCPSKVKGELKDALELEMLKQTLPRVATYEVCWNIVDGWVLFHNSGEAANELFRKLFFRTFGYQLLPFDPLEWVSDRPEQLDALASSGASDLRAWSSGVIDGTRAEPDEDDGGIDQEVR